MQAYQYWAVALALLIQCSHSAVKGVHISRFLLSLGLLWKRICESRRALQYAIEQLLVDWPLRT